MVSSAMLDTNHEQLVWAGTPVGGRASQSLYIKNASDSDTMTLTLAIHDSQHFKFDAYPKPSSTLEVTMPARAERNVGLFFSPAESAVYRATAVIRPAAADRNRDTTVIPLSGYGGSSDVQIHVNARDSTGRPCLSLNSMAPAGSRLANFSIANIGVRGAYIKLLLFTDMSCTQQLSAHQATILPCEFILRAGESRQVSAATPAGARPPSSPTAGGVDVGTVLVLSGDEALRQQMKQMGLTSATSCGGRDPALVPGAHRLAPDNLRAVDFLTLYDGERSVVEENVSMAVPATKIEEVFYNNMKQTKLPLKYLDRPAAPHVAQPVNGNTALPRTGTPQGFSRLHSEQSNIPLELTKRPAAAPSGSLPSLPDPGWWPRPPGRPHLQSDPDKPRFLVSTDHLLFPRTPLGIPRTMPIQLDNRGCDALKWNIFGYSMPYLITEPGKMVKCGYDVFKVRPQDGILKPDQQTTLTLTFSPPYPGQLTQMFQLLCKPANETPGMPMVVCTLPVQVSGRGSVLDEGENEADLLVAPLHVSENNLYFQHWSICHKLEITNKLREDLGLEYCVTGPFKVVAGPNERSVNDLTEGRMMAPSQRYVQMSVYFCPEQVGSFQGELTLWLRDSPWRHLVKLAGSCEDLDVLMQGMQQTTPPV